MNGRCGFFATIGIAVLLSGCGGAVDPNNLTGQAECPAGFVLVDSGTCRNAAGCTPDFPFAWSDGQCRDKPEPECDRDWDCDDGLFCNGWEACAAGRCVAGDPPCAVGEECDEDFRECSVPEVSTVDEILDASWLVVWWHDGLSFGGVGSAFAIEGNLLGTNAHVVESAAAVARLGGWVRCVQHETGDVLDMATMWVHPDYDGTWDSPDVGVIEVDGRMLVTLTIADNDTLRGLQVFDEVRLSGFPGELSNLDLIRPRATMLSGHITALRPFDPSQAVTPETAMLIQHDMPTTGGTSGSPVLNNSGEVVALNNSGFTGQGQSNFAVRADALAELLAWIDAGGIYPVDMTDPCDGVQCDDGLFCNGQEACVDGYCVSYGPPCAAGEECDEDADVCVWGCRTDADCDDGDPCTGDECVDGECVSTDECLTPPPTAPPPPPADPCSGVDCDDSDPCTDDGCMDGLCVHAVVDCDDGLLCNGRETCLDGMCVAGNPPCGSDECDEDAQVCVGAGAVTVPFGYKVEEFVEINRPVGMSFDLDGGMYVGNGSASGTYIRLVPPDGSSVTQIGDHIRDPDVVLVDVHGYAVDAGSVLVGSTGSIGVVEPTTGATSTFSDWPHVNVSGLLFDSAGNLFALHLTRKLFVVEDGVPELVAAFPSGQTTGLAIDGNDDVFVGQRPDGNVFRIDPDGPMMVATLTSGVNALACAVTGPLSGSMFAVTDTAVYEVDPQTGSSSILASGFSLANQIAFGPAGDMFVSDAGAGIIFRISQRD